MRFRFCVLMVACLLTPLGAKADDGFALQDFIGRAWRHESVHFAASPADLAAAHAGRPLIGPDGKAVLYQVDGTAIDFIADLDPFERRVYRFADAPAAPPAGDLKIEETADTIRLVNGRTGIALRKRLKPGEGPVQSIRLTSGNWIGDSALAGAPPVRAYSVKVLARGPVFAELDCDVNFGEGRHWRMRLRLQADEPAILVDETFSLGMPAAFKLLLSPRFAPDTLFYRFGKGYDSANHEGKLATFPVPTNYAATVFVLEPWLHWWERERQGTWFALYNSRSTDLLAMAARAPARWVAPGRIDQQAAAQLFLDVDKSGLAWTLPLKSGARAWLIEALDKAQSLAPLEGKDLYRAPLPQQVQIKHGDFPLDRVKDYVLQWPAAAADHPRLIVTERDVATFCNTFTPDPNKLASLRTAAVSLYRMDEPIAYYLCTRDAALGRHLVAAAVAQLQEAVDMLVKQDRLLTIGFAPHTQVVIMTAINLADAVWSDPQLTSDLRARMRAQIAFLGYTVARDDYWSPERGFAANPNMTSTVAAYRALIGAMIPSHPMARAWVAKGLGELKSQLDDWADDNGGWLEAPHYAMASYDYLLGSFLVAHNAGLGSHLFDPKMKKVIEWFAKISTPPDALAAGHRHLPPIGNTYIREPTGEFGLVAHLWKDKDPKFAAQMQWMDREQGSLDAPGVGGFYPALAGYRPMLRDKSIVPKPPAYGSELFPRTGVVLRHRFPSARETQAYLIAGANHAHYDKDSGSVTLWGKGRLVAGDFGYQGYMPGEDHNMVIAGEAPDRAIMTVMDFSPGARLDYVRAKKNGWTRQIAFVKNGDAAGSDYFVIADSLAAPEPATWRLWLNASKVTVDASRAAAIGREDVDTDIFFARPAGVRLSTEAKTRVSPGVTGKTYGTVSTAQIGLIAANDGKSGFTALIYPRLKNESGATAESIDQGRMLVVRQAAGTDYVFLADAPFRYRDKDIAFEGTVGLVQVRGGVARLSLGARGSLAAFGKTLTRAE